MPWSCLHNGWILSKNEEKSKPPAQQSLWVVKKESFSNLSVSEQAKKKGGGADSKWSHHIQLAAYLHWVKSAEISSCTVWRKLMGKKKQPWLSSLRDRDAWRSPGGWLGLGVGFLGPCTPLNWAPVALHNHAEIAWPRALWRVSADHTLISHSFALRITSAGFLAWKLQCNPWCQQETFPKNSVAPSLASQVLLCVMEISPAVAQCAETNGFPAEKNTTSIPPPEGHFLCTEVPGDLVQLWCRRWPGWMPFCTDHVRHKQQIAHHSDYPSQHDWWTKRWDYLNLLLFH